LPLITNQRLFLPSAQHPFFRTLALLFASMDVWNLVEPSPPNPYSNDVPSSQNSLHLCTHSLAYRGIVS
jgi:hypothetical protein